jgi:methyl-accepting chemotaxis protein
MRRHVFRKLSFDQIGLVTRLLIPALLSVVLAVALVQAWTLRVVERNGMAEAQARLSASLAVLHERLQPLGNEWAITDGKFTLGGNVLDDRNDLVDSVRTATGAVATLFRGDTRVATNIETPDGSRAVGTKLVPGPAYDAVIRDGHTYRGENVILGVPHLTIYEPVYDAQGKRQVGILFVGVPLTEVRGAIDRITQEAVTAALVVAAVIGLAYWWILRRTIRPLTGLAGVMRAIAGGRLDTTVPCTRRSDQIGDMARALLDLRDASARTQLLEQEAAAARTRGEAEKRQALRAMADTIERDADVAVTRVSEGGAEMAATADAMSAAASRTGESARAAAGAAEEALATAQTVASAAKELSASIHEIAAQVSQSTRIVGRAVEAGRGTKETIRALTERVGRIGDMAGIIAGIASRTNLLALNATIEAARAGEAGKGFAVVASEVKQLATQTARSTEDIARHIAEVRGATNDAVAAVDLIEATIGEIDGIAAAIAASVEEQGAATAEIARNVARTASAAREVAGRIADVSGEVARTTEDAASVRGRAMELARSVRELREAIMGTVRASVRDEAGDMQEPERMAA